MLQAGRSSPHPSDEANEPTLFDIVSHVMGVVRRQLPIFIVFLCCSFLLGFLYLFTTPPHYTATADLVIDTRKVQVFEKESILGDNIVDTGTVQTQVEVIKSSGVMDSVIKDLHLIDDPEFTGPRGGLFGLIGKLFSGGASTATQSDQDLMRIAEANFASHLTVGRVGTTYVIAISFSSLDRAKAARIANAVADAYILDQLDAKYEVTKRAGAWLQSRIGELRAQATAAERAVVDFKDKNNIVDAGNGRLMNQQQLAELNSQLILAHAATAEAKARLDRVEEVMKQPVQTASVADALNNQIIVRLRSQYLTLAGQEAMWAQKYGPNHLAVINLRNQMEELKRNIYDEMTKIAESYRSDYDIALTRERALQNSLARSVAKTETTNHAQIEMRELESNANTYRTLYNNFLQRYMEAVQQESFPISEARVITPATLPFTPSSPKKLLVLLVTTAGGLLLSFGVAAAREMADRVFRESAQIENLLHLNCLTTLPAIRPGLNEAVEAPPATMPQMTPALPPVKDDDPILRYAVQSPLSQFTEGLRSVKVAVDLNGILKMKKIIGFTSTLPNEGKTTVGTNFARLLAHSGSRAILIDADIRNPSLSRHLAPDARLGLVDILAGRCTAAEAQFVDPATGLIFIPTGSVSKIVHSAELLGSEKMKNLIEKLNESFDYVILDLPPLSPIVDVRMTTSFVDSYVFVVEWGRTRINAVARATQAASEVHDRILGVVLNKANTRLLGRYDSYRALSYGREYYSRYGYVE